MSDKPTKQFMQKKSPQGVQETQNQTEYVWEFPCTLPIKVMGPAKSTLEPLTKKIIQNHVPEFLGHDMRSAQSKTGKYISLTVDVVFSNKQQIDDLFAELSHHQQNGDDISFVI